MGLVASDKNYLSQLQDLLPSGPAWPRDDEANLTKLLYGLAGELSRVDGLVHQLLAETDVRTAAELLPSWERLLGLPDDCMSGLALSITNRRRVAHQRLVEQGGQSAAYFIGLATLLGEEGCTITEFAPSNCNSNCNSPLNSDADRFVWRVNIPRPANNARFANCNSDCDDALQIYEPSLIECPINERKPAHTHVQFSYTA